MRWSVGNFRQREQVSKHRVEKQQDLPPPTKTVGVQVEVPKGESLCQMMHLASPLYSEKSPSQVLKRAMDK